MLAIILLVVMLQWNPDPPTTTTQRPVAASPYIQSVTQCLHSGKVCALS